MTHYIPTDSNLLWENQVVCFTVEASLGLITTEMEALYVEVLPSEVVLHVASLASNESVRANAEEIASKLTIQLDNRIQVRLELFQGRDDWSWEGRSHRGIFARRL